MITKLDSLNDIVNEFGVPLTSSGNISYYYNNKNPDSPVQPLVPNTWLKYTLKRCEASFSEISGVNISVPFNINPTRKYPVVTAAPVSSRITNFLLVLPKRQFHIIDGFS